MGNDRHSVGVKQVQPGMEEAALMAFDDELESSGDIRQALAAVVSRFPASASLLTDYALTRSMEPPSSASLAALETRVMERADAMLSASAERSRSDRITSLLVEIKTQGIDLGQFARSLALGVSVVVKLDRRLIEVATIPSSLVDALATALSRSATEILHYLEMPPTLSPAARYRANQAPELSSTRPRERFANALRTAVEAGEITRADELSWTDEK